MHKSVNRFCRENEGAALIEYAILIALIAVICATAVAALGTEINPLFSKISRSLSIL